MSKEEDDNQNFIISFSIRGKDLNKEEISSVFGIEEEVKPRRKPNKDLWCSESWCTSDKKGVQELVDFLIEIPI